MKFDMHCHTKEGSIDSKLPIEDFIKILISKGFDGMLISDHDSYKGYRAYLDKELDKKYPNFVVLQGIEYDTVDAGHILCIMPDDVTLGILEIKGMPVKMLIDIVHYFGGILGPAHPAGIHYQSYINTMKQNKQYKYLKKFDFIEKFNACESPESNHKAAFLCNKSGLPGFGGSDAHKDIVAGLGYTKFPPNIKITCQNDLIAFIKKGGKGTVAGGRYYRETVRNKIGFLYDNVLMSLYWIYNKGGAKINTYRHNSRLRELFLEEMKNKKSKKTSKDGKS